MQRFSDVHSIAKIVMTVMTNVTILTAMSPLEVQTRARMLGVPPAPWPTPTPALVPAPCFQDAINLVINTGARGAQTSQSVVIPDRQESVARCSTAISPVAVVPKGVLAALSATALHL